MNARQITDTTNFFSIDYGDVILINNKEYRVTGHERERRFGIDDPKFWVKKVIDTETGEKKIIKLSHFETFEINLGGVKISRFRNPQKEGDILNLVKNHPHFMQGQAFEDSKGNNIRILDIVKGENFLLYLGSVDLDHEDYFFTLLPDILKELIKCFEAIKFLHLNGYKHGDIRNDHILVEKDSGNYVWIDFDYDFNTNENPFGLDIFELGNVLVYAIGKGFHNLHKLKGRSPLYGDLIDKVRQRDFSILNRARFLNLRKLYPYIPVSLNNILGHFSMGAEIFYETVEEILVDMKQYLYSINEL